MARNRRAWRGPLGMNLADLVVLAVSVALLCYAVLTTLREVRRPRRQRPRTEAATTPPAARPAR